ncbi:hypothetical protein AN958_09678 [Leucoagaricus sp. SymC.cos]|nr:hypothetical protein AN958_09678 [Leucoagaricus sp. SymC.cos]
MLEGHDAIQMRIESPVLLEKLISRGKCTSSDQLVRFRFRSILQGDIQLSGIPVTPTKPLKADLPIEC